MTKAEYASYLQSPHWRRTRARALAQAGYQCTYQFVTWDGYKTCETHRCPNQKHLQVHHLNYEWLWAERDEDLEVLCRDCHLLRHLTCEACGESLFADIDEQDMWERLRTECQESYEGQMDLTILREILSWWPNENLCDHCAHGLLSPD
jgi:hypothetical protein